jgi:hypothetical protein
MPSVGNDPNDGFCDVSSNNKVSLNGWCWRMDAYKLRSTRARCCGGPVPLDALGFGGMLPARFIASHCWPGPGRSTIMCTASAMYTPNHLGRICHTCMDALCKLHQAGLNTDIGRQTWMTTWTPPSTYPRTPPNRMTVGGSRIHGSSGKGRWDVESRWSMEPPHGMRYPYPCAAPRK